MYHLAGRKDENALYRFAIVFHAIYSSDPELTYQARNFSSLSHEQKQALG